MIDPNLIKLQNQLPFLPGHRFDMDKNRPNERKSHAFDYRNGVPVFQSSSPGIGGIPLPGQAESRVHTSVEIYAHNNGSQESVPAWVAFDRKVLRFYGYFQEAVHEKREETYRIRQVNIYFYLEDDTVHVSEPKTENSGIPQGTLIRRHRIPKSEKANGQHYIVSDFNVGKEVTFYNRTFKIVGCDLFTREFLENLSIQVPSNSEFPDDPYELCRKELLSRMKATRPYVPNSSLKKFLENDRRVLRFYCVWDDTNSVFGDARHMVLHYFLSDDTIEIQESIPANSGRQSNSLFLRRCRLPKRPQVSRVNGKNPGSNPQNFFSERDLTIGSILHLYGRPFVICDCDEFTKNFYRENYGLENFTPVRIEDYDDNEAAAPQLLQPEKPHIPLIGDDHVPKKDFKKMVLFDGVHLRFAAHLKTTKQVDRDRRFVISLFLADDEIAVFEPKSRNSGILSGKFLAKSRIKKSDGVSYFEPQDFYLGAELTFYNHTFVLFEADEYAITYMNQHPEIFKKQAALNVASAASQT